MIYAIRRRLWGRRPSGWLLASSAADLGIAPGLAIWGVAMTPLPAPVVAELLAAPVVFAFAFAFALVLDLVKIPLFARLGIVLRAVAVAVPVGRAG